MQRYYVSVNDQKEQTYLFHMERSSSGGAWKIVDAPVVPLWIHDVEAQLTIAIAHHEGQAGQAAW
ncbi:hypothetical protein GCM10023184_28190 [Flaviaesturariibacter amylovorans]|uniref:Uncharacterized protein n=2 Tax=Flaviaesturariibacter amylovorans TaxID=1084520 RepID=A0ABP8H4N0_9BACT